MTKLTFGCILLPIVYLIGFLQRENAENIYKSLGLIMYMIGHLMNMIILSIIEFDAQKSNDRVCSWNQFLIPLVAMLINPFTYNFFNPVLDYFLCRDLSHQGHIFQLAYSLVHLTFACLILFSVIKLEQSSFFKLFEVEKASSSSSVEELGR